MIATHQSPHSEYLEYQSSAASLNQNGISITCIRFAPDAPKQNPGEGIWLQAKVFVQ